MKTFAVTIKERGNNHLLHTSYTGTDETTISMVEDFFGVHNNDVESYEIYEVAILDDKQPELHPTVKQYLDMKAKHHDAVLLFRIGDFYESYCTDAQTLASVCSITMTKRLFIKEPDGKGLRIAGFPHHALDTYLPKLIRAGQRVAICDQLEDPKKKSK